MKLLNLSSGDNSGFFSSATVAHFVVVVVVVVEIESEFEFD